MSKCDILFYTGVKSLNTKFENKSCVPSYLQCDNKEEHSPEGTIAE